MKVKFVPQNIEVEATPEKSLLQIATDNHIEIKSICKGVPSCAECRVRIVEGDSNVLPPNKAELSLLGTNWRIDGRRLSCQVRCFGDITVDMAEQLERQESQSKKVRGFRTQKHMESHAVQDTMLLTEKPEDKPEQQARPERALQPQQERSQSQQKQNPQNKNQNKHQHQKQKNQQQQKQQGKPQQKTQQKN